MEIAVWARLAVPDLVLSRRGLAGNLLPDVAPAPVAAVFHLLPYLLPFLAPGEGAAANGAGLLGEERFLVRHIRGKNT